MKIHNTELRIIQADITELKVDAIVNAANNQLLMGGGVAGVIKDKGGAEIETEAVAKGPIGVGESLSTKAGQLPAQYIIHSATMAMDFKTDQDKVRAAAASALLCAHELKLTSIAFPALGCGVGKFPLVGAAKIMTQEVMKFLKHHETTVKEIVFCLYDEKSYEVFDQAVTGYVNHIQKNLGPGPYVCTDILIEYKDGLIIIERSNPPYGYALPGGFLDYGESLEEGARREAKEETNLDLEDLKQFHTYSDPGRDPRFHTISTVFLAKGVGSAQFGDDAKGLRIVPIDELMNYDYAFDHKEIIKSYLNKKGKS